MAERKQIDTSTAVFDNGSEREIFFYYGELPTGGTYSAGETVNAVQGEIATYRFTYTNEIAPQTIQFDIDFGGTIGVDSQIVSFVPVESKVVEFTKLIPINEDTPRTATITDNVGGTPYDWEYGIETQLTLSYTPVIGISHFVMLLFEGSASVPSMRIDWGDGTIENIVVGNVYHTYTSATPVVIKIRGVNGRSISEYRAFIHLSGGDFTNVLDFSKTTNIADLDFVLNMPNVTEFICRTSIAGRIKGVGLSGCTRLVLDVGQFGTSAAPYGEVIIITGAVNATTIEDLDPNTLITNNIGIEISGTGVNDFAGFTNPLNVIGDLNLSNNAMPLSVLNFASVGNINASNNGASAANIDSLINSVEASATLNNVQNKTFTLTGNTAPTAASAVALAALRDAAGLNWTVTTD